MWTARIADADEHCRRDGFVALGEVLVRLCSPCELGMEFRLDSDLAGRKDMERWHQELRVRKMFIYSYRI